MSMKMIIKRMEKVVDRMDDLRQYHLRQRENDDQREAWDARSSLAAEDEILPVTVWPDSVLRH